jgi:hypothetical protein
MRMRLRTRPDPMVTVAKTPLAPVIRPSTDAILLNFGNIAAPINAPAPRALSNCP